MLIGSKSFGSAKSTIQSIAYQLYYGPVLENKIGPYHGLVSNFLETEHQFSPESLSQFGLASLKKTAR
jgi:hypothetical protein